MEVLQEFHAVVNAPGEYARKIKQASNKRILGYFCTYTPEEIIHAAGIHPMRLFGTRGGITHADAYMQAYSCSLVRGALEQALSGELSYLDGAVFPHTCDSIQRLSDIWRLNAGFTFHADVVLPVKLDTDSAREYMVDVLRKFRRDLESKLGITIGDEDLKKSISTYNRLRRSIKSIYRLQSASPGILRGEDLYALVKASMVMDRDEAAGKVEGLVRALEGKAVPAGNPGRKRLVLSGGICDHPQIYSLIERVGGAVVWDDLCNGSRFFEGEIAEGGDPVSAIAARYTERVICPAKHSSLTRRGENLVQIAREHDAAGVIFMLLKFCDPHAFDYPYLKEFLDREGVPSMLLEIEQELPAEGQLGTRFEAFIEMLQ